MAVINSHISERTDPNTDRINNDVNLNAPCIYTDLFMLTIKESDFKIEPVHNSADKMFERKNET